MHVSSENTCDLRTYVQLSPPELQSDKGLRIFHFISRGKIIAGVRMGENDRSLDDRMRRLEGKFFPSDDPGLTGKLRDMKQMRESREALSQALGVRNEAVINQLLELDVAPEVVTALMVIPFLEVAWAEGTIDDNGRAAVLACAERLGFVRGGVDYALLEQWLQSRPEPKLFRAWSHCIEGICEQLTNKEIEVLKTSFLNHARTVALAAGGERGTGSMVSLSGAQILRSLEAAFHH